MKINVIDFRENKSSPTGAWKWNFPPFVEIMADWPTNRLTDGLIRKFHFQWKIEDSIVKSKDMAIQPCDTGETYDLRMWWCYYVLERESVFRPIDYIRRCWMCIFPMNPYVTLLVGQSVSEELIIEKGGKLHFHAPIGGLVENIANFTCILYLTDVVILFCNVLSLSAYQNCTSDSGFSSIVYWFLKRATPTHFHFPFYIDVDFAKYAVVRRNPKG